MNKTVEFDGQIYSIDDILTSRRVKTFFEPNWTRVEIKLSGRSFLKIEEIEKWIVKEFSGLWGSYHYQKTNKEYRMVLFFKDKDEALMFRLKDNWNG